MNLVRFGIGKTPRNPYPSDVMDEEWAFVAPCLTLRRRTLRSGGTTRARCPSPDLRAMLRWIDGRTDDPTAVILHHRTVQSTSEIEALSQIAALGSW